MAWIGLRGMTTRRPGMWVKRDSGDWEWYLGAISCRFRMAGLRSDTYIAPCPTPPQGILTVMPPTFLPFVPSLYLNFAASFTS